MNTLVKYHSTAVTTMVNVKAVYYVHSIIYELYTICIHIYSHIGIVKAFVGWIYS